MKYTAMGMTSGIGSMLIGARTAGFKVLGNVEWRRYYHAKDEQGRNTFTENFPGTFFVHRLEEIDYENLHVDLLMGHPECGNFSMLSNSNKNRIEKLQKPGDIPLFIDAVAKIQPRFFVMDDLPRCLEAFDITEYHSRLPNYDLFPEWISNYHYGNPQWNRRRMFMIGSRKEERFTFIPGETDVRTTVKDVIGDIYKKYGSLPNHDPHVMDTLCNHTRHVFGRDTIGTVRDLAKYFRSHPEGHILHYIKADGGVGLRFGFSRGYWNKHAFVLSGTNPMIHPLSGLPLTLRERLRIQGAPDDFILYGTAMTGKRWNHFTSTAMIKQTGKFMPVQFCEYVARQILAHIKNRSFRSSGVRIIKPNSCVTVAKQEFCRKYGYSDQSAACAACWQKQNLDCILV